MEKTKKRELKMMTCLTVSFFVQIGFVVFFIFLAVGNCCCLGFWGNVDLENERKREGEPPSEEFEN